jgi:hypothetical protein
VIFAPYYPTYYPLYYPYYPSYDYGGGYAPTTSTQQAPQQVPQQTSEPAAPQVWYYCDPLKGCYPCAQSCRAGWYQVSTTTPNASQP